MSMQKREPYGIWWLNNRDLEVLWRIGLKRISDKIEAQLTSMAGRPLRGRLWADEEFENVNVESCFRLSTPLVRMCAVRGGVVLGEDDIASVAYLPGFVTDLNLKPIQMGGVR